MTAGIEGLSAAEVYEEGLVAHIFREWTPVLLAAARPAAGERVLDLACGTGAVTRALGPVLGASGSIVGVDVNPEMLAVARRIAIDGAPVEWREASALDLPLPDADVDLVVCQQGLQFFPDKAVALGEIVRVLRPGGRVALSVWRDLDHNPAQRALNAVRASIIDTPYFTLPFSYGDPDVVAAAFDAAGLRDVDVRTETRSVSFDSVRQFVTISMVGAAAVVPALGALTDAQRGEMIEASVEALTPLADEFGGENPFRFPMTSLVVTATRP